LNKEDKTIYPCGKFYEHIKILDKLRRKFLSFIELYVEFFKYLSENFFYKILENMEKRYGDKKSKKTIEKRKIKRSFFKVLCKVQSNICIEVVKIYEI